MSKGATLSYRKNELREIQQIIMSNEKQIAEELGRDKRRYLETTILDNDYMIEIIRMFAVVEHPNLGKYTAVTDCAFMTLDGRSVLAVDLRGQKANVENVTVVIAEVRLEGKITVLGFIVDRVEDFYSKIL